MKDEMRVDERDVEILEVLESDARIPWRQLAKKLGVSEATIYLRVKRLEGSGVIRGYTVLVDLEKLGVTARALVRLKSKPGYSESIAKLVAEDPHVLEAYEVTGTHNIVVLVAASSLEELALVINYISSKPGVADVETLFVLKVIKDRESVIRMLKGRSGESPRP